MKRRAKTRSLTAVKKNHQSLNEAAAVKNPEGITTRYLGNDERRLFCLQRGDSKYWTGGDGWSRILDEARIFHTHKAAQAACSALQYAMFKGKPLRKFNVTVTVTLVADDVESVSQEELTRYLGEATNMEVNNVVFGDGPVDGSFAQLRLPLGPLEETVASRKRF